MIIASRTLMVMAFSTCFAAQSLFIGNSVSPEKLGTANGLALFVSDIVRYVQHCFFFFFDESFSLMHRGKNYYI